MYGKLNLTPRQGLPKPHIFNDFVEKHSAIVVNVERREFRELLRRFASELFFVEVSAAIGVQCGKLLGRLLLVIRFGDEIVCREHNV